MFSCSLYFADLLQMCQGSFAQHTVISTAAVLPLSHTRPTTGRHDRQPRGELGGAELPLGVRVRFRKVFDRTG